MRLFARKSLLMGALVAMTALLGCDASPVVPIPSDADIPSNPPDSRGAGGGGGAGAMSARPPAARPAPPAPEYDFGSTTPVHKRGNIYLAGQPAEDDFKKIAQSGVTRVISLCRDGEVSWDEKAAVEAAGMTFYHFPVASPDDLTPELLDNVRGLLAESGDNPTLLHCKGAVRAAAAYIPYAVVDAKQGLEGTVRGLQSVSNLKAEWRDKALLYAKELVDKAKAEAETTTEESAEDAGKEGSGE